MRSAADTPSIEVEAHKDAAGNVVRVQVRFGPHYLVEVNKNQDLVVFELRATHHGFTADAST